MIKPLFFLMPIIAEILVMMLPELTGVAELACVIGILALVVVGGVRLSDKIINRAIGR